MPKYKKVYGQSRREDCPFCHRQSTTTNKQGIPVCPDHKDQQLAELKCVCGEYLDPVKGKFGAYFRCMQCGNISFAKAMEVNGGSTRIQKGSVNTEKKETGLSSAHPSDRPLKKERKEFTITSDQVDVYYT